MNQPATPHWTVRLATAEDLEALATLNAEVQQLHYVAEPSEYKEPNHEAAKAHFDGVFDEGNLFVLVAESEGVIAGYLMAEEARRPDNAIKHGANFLYVHHIATSQVFRRRGVGAVLVAHARQLARDRDLSDLRLNTGAFNQDAQEFFQAQGFHVFEYRMLRPA